MKVTCVLATVWIGAAFGGVSPECYFAYYMTFSPHYTDNVIIEH